MARFNNQDVLTDEEWAIIAIGVKKKYFGMKAEQLEQAITNGIQGKYNDTQPSINAFTIFKWIEKYWFDGTRLRGDM